jgi:hypothetical protein
MRTDFIVVPSPLLDAHLRVSAIPKPVPSGSLAGLGAVLIAIPALLVWIESLAIERMRKRFREELKGRPTIRELLQRDPDSYYREDPRDATESRDH